MSKKKRRNPIARRAPFSFGQHQKGVGKSIDEDQKVVYFATSPGDADGIAPVIVPQPEASTDSANMLPHERS